jgi:hypothetical protein
VVRTRRGRGRRRGVAAARGAAPATGGRRVDCGVHGRRSRPPARSLAPPPSADQTEGCCVTRPLYRYIHVVNHTIVYDITAFFAHEASEPHQLTDDLYSACKSLPRLTRHLYPTGKAAQGSTRLTTPVQHSASLTWQIGFFRHTTTETLTLRHRLQPLRSVARSALLPRTFMTSKISPHERAQSCAGSRFSGTAVAR